MFKIYARRDTSGKLEIINGRHRALAMWKSGLVARYVTTQTPGLFEVFFSKPGEVASASKDA